MPGTFVIIAAGMFVAALVALVASAVMPNEESSATEDRLATLASRRPGGPDSKDQPSLLVAGSLDDQKVGFKAIFDSMPQLRQYLEQADIEMSPALFAGICGGCFAGGVFVTVVSPLPVLLAPVAGLLIAAIPIGWLLMKRKRRLAKFGKQMPEALELLSRSLRAGHSLNAGFGLVGQEMEAPLSVEFARCFEEQKFGIPLDEAIEDMAARVPNMDLRFFATAIILQRQTGGDLSEILDKIGRLVRERLQIQGQIQALTGEGRMSGAVLLALPPVLFLVMLKLNYDYVMMLFTDPAGRYMLGAALFSQLLGALAIKKIITIKV
ncbi:MULTISPECIES: type II secretion system F family protein [Crateriforma]|uniref:Bacterial type II secretion system protein F domain protein n=1 Tax=Crateriforma conspicua TaxID=2527996 RepID=A0A5C6FNA8_9PLAN|nr:MULTISPECIES: type II secretion system F family protein [Crateriforma]QDV61939.1 Bacterial type II secretion system protein F domain protein [Crateriforma conspicua]TWT71812.1 Bacterial type II secretion system protein F domain protein [Crateriforma conspicua]TWU62682.1 Bacterial type II secretion system protein F domain protein [Crateriforma conspicua]